MTTDAPGWYRSLVDLVTVTRETAAEVRAAPREGTTLDLSSIAERLDTMATEIEAMIGLPPSAIVVNGLTVDRAE